MGLWRTTSRHSWHSQDNKESIHTADPKDIIDRTPSQNDPVASADQAAGTAWLAGHLHHLTRGQEAKLVEFKAEVEHRGYYTPGKDGHPASHDDATLLRYLRARKFDVAGAFNQFKDTEEWRAANAIEALYENINVEAYEDTRRMYPQWTGRRDRRGIPIYVFEVKHLNGKNMATYTSKVSSSAPSETHKSSSVPARLLSLFALYENLLRFVMPLCSALPRPNPETPIVTSTNIVDISGVGLRQFWNLRSHMQDASVLATAHYPETLDRIFIIGAPAFFPTVWNWIKRWFDPVTVSKIFILSAAEVKPTLTSFMDPSSFPTQYGGELGWQWGDHPLLDEEARQVAGGMEIPAPSGQSRPDYTKGPVLFHGDKIEVLGTEGGKLRRSIIPVTKPPAAPPADEPVSQDSSETKVNGDLETAAAATEAVTEPVTKPLPTPDANEKVSLETNGATVLNETPVA